MPVETPWIRTYDFPGEYTKGYGLGLEGAKAQASLQQQANEMAQRAAMQQEQLAARQAEIELETKTRKEIAEKNLLAEQARADITSAYHQANLGLQKQRLEQAAALADLKIKQAARQVGSEERIRQRIAAGEDKYKVLMEEGAPAGYGGAGMAAIARASQAAIPKDLEITQRGDESFFRSSPTEAYKHIPRGVGEDLALDRAEIAAGEREIAVIQKFLREGQPDEDQKAQAKLELAAAQKRVNDIYARRNRSPAYPGAAMDWSSAKQIGKFRAVRRD